MKNPLQNAKVVGVNFDTAAYIVEDSQRGDPTYAMSRGALMEFARCPIRWLRGIGSDETKSTEWGSLIDTLALQPETFAAKYAIAPAVYPCEPTKKDPRTEKPWNANSNWCDEWKAWQERNGRIVIKSGEYLEAKSAVNCLLADKQIAALIADSEKQVCVIANYHDPATSIVVPVKILIDCLPSRDGEFHNTIADLKTSESAEPSRWIKSVHNFDYDAQGAMQLDVFNAATGEERADFRHIIQESYQPYQTGRRLLSVEFLELGRMKYRNALAKYCQCLATGVWPDYDSHAAKNYNGWQLVEPEAWMVNA